MSRRIVQCPNAGNAWGGEPQSLVSTLSTKSFSIRNKRSTLCQHDDESGRSTKKPRGQRASAVPSRAASLLCQTLCESHLQLYLLGGQCCDRTRRHLQSREAALLRCDGWVHQPSRWREHRLSALEPTSRDTGVPRTRFDKAFCVEWIDDSTLAVSTKSGHILKVDRGSRTFQEVDLEGVRWASRTNAAICSKGTFFVVCPPVACPSTC
jgi:hypothetical protein